MSDEEILALPPMERAQYIQRTQGPYGITETQQSTTPLDSRWFSTVQYVAQSPYEHDFIYRRIPLLTTLSYADRKREEEGHRRKAYEQLVRAKHPMAFMMLFMK